MKTNLAKFNNFYIRVGTSDEKTVQEVVVKKDYERKDFKPEKDDIWADIGANIGAFSKLYAPIVKKIYAYEPSKQSYEVLQMNTAEFTNVETINKAVNNYDGIIEFYERPKQNWRNSTRNLFKDSVLVFLDCIDASKLPKDVTAVKLDVEGSELEILQTLNLKQLDKIVMEWSFDFLPQVKYYNQAVAKLKANFDVVKYQEVKAEIWQKNWFPPCKKIFAYNVKEKR